MRIDSYLIANTTAVYLTLFLRAGWAVSSFGPQSDSRYIWLYGVIILATIIVGILRARLWFRFTIGAAESLHERSMWAVMHAPLTFFHANPTGALSCLFPCLLTLDPPSLASTPSHLVQWQAVF